MKTYEFSWGSHSVTVHNASDLNDAKRQLQDTHKPKWDKLISVKNVHGYWGKIKPRKLPATSILFED